jgi:hypothetical protein
VLSALPAFSILLVMVLLRRDNWGNRFRVAVFCGLVGVVAYGVTNPYVVYHVLRGGGGALGSNLGNTTEFYKFDRLGDAIINTGRLIVAGTSPVLCIAGVLAVVLLGVRAVRNRQDESPAEVRRRAHGLLLATPAVLTAVQFSLLAAGKPGEYGRFFLLTDVFLAIEAFVVLHWFVACGGAPSSVQHGDVERTDGIEKPGGSLQLWRTFACVVAAGLLVLVGIHGARYLRGFINDSGGETSRLAAARQIESLRQAGAKRLVIAAEPAPYAVPPAGLFGWEMILVPKGTRPEQFAQPGDVILEVREGDTPISWAEKPFVVRKWP